ncbi:DUF1028 domain-containing protein [Oceanospirillaceae bacterium]|nr:DUF1028 domain-containing protein [Oceanospirillaceae bacterium]MDC1340826.1 DUF1028 domain-containing protein [Oceanospirillaceae bacterium]
MTFSLAGVCPTTGMVGCVITSSSICVASRCAFTRSGVGVALTQNITNPDLGTLALSLLERGEAVDTIIPALGEADTDIQWRQLGVIGLNGQSQTFSGKEILGINARAAGKNCIAMGNLLSNTKVPQAMVEAFEASSGHLCDRLLAALEAGQAAGGEMGPLYSAGLRVNASPAWPIVDLRVDWHENPVSKLGSLWQIYQPQMQAYITRASDPANAKPYGVPGDE